MTDQTTFAKDFLSDILSTMEKYGLKDIRMEADDFFKVLSITPNVCGCEEEVLKAFQGVSPDNVTIEWDRIYVSSDSGYIFHIHRT